MISSILKLFGLVKKEEEKVVVEPTVQDTKTTQPKKARGRPKKSAK